MAKAKEGRKKKKRSDASLGKRERRLAIEKKALDEERKQFEAEKSAFEAKRKENGQAGILSVKLDDVMTKFNELVVILYNVNNCGLTVDAVASGLIEVNNAIDRLSKCVNVMNDSIVKELCSLYVRLLCITQHEQNASAMLKVEADQLFDLLTERLGVMCIEPQAGDPFDQQHHTKEDLAVQGNVVRECVQVGWLRENRVLARAVVGLEPSIAEPAEPNIAETDKGE